MSLIATIPDTSYVSGSGLGTLHSFISQAQTLPPILKILEPPKEKVMKSRDVTLYSKSPRQFMLEPDYRSSSWVAKQMFFPLCYWAL